MITVTAATATKGYDGTTTSSATPTITSGSLASGDTAAFSETFDNRNVGTGKTLTASGSVNDGNDGNDYAVTFATSTTGQITARAITVTAAAATKDYDGTATTTVTPTITAGTLATGDTAAFTETFDNANAGTGKTLTASGSVNDGNGGNNYAVTFAAANTTGAINSPATAGVSGYVYVSSGGASWGIPGVTLTLTSQSGGQSTQWGMTDGEGYFSFGSLVAGTYQLTEALPSNYVAATETVGNAGGSPESNGFSGITLIAGQQGSGYVFTSSGLAPSGMTMRFFTSMLPPWSQVFAALHQAPVVALDGGQGTDFTAPSVRGNTAVSIVNAGTASIFTADNDNGR